VTGQSICTLRSFLENRTQSNNPARVVDVDKERLGKSRTRVRTLSFGQVGRTTLRCA